MVLTHVVDTSVVTRARRPEVAARLGALLRGRQVGCTPMTTLEAGFSARTAREFDALSEALDVFERVPVVDADFRHAQTIQRILALHGHRGRKIPDLLIAAAAERLGLTLLHYDYDFELIAEVTGQAHEWVVPRGSVD